MLLSVLKALGLVSAVVCHFIGTTAPIPPAGEGDKISKEQLFEQGQVRNFLGLTAKLAFALPMLAEATLVLLTTLYSSHIDNSASRVVYATLCPQPKDEAAETIQRITYLFVVGVLLMAAGAGVRLWTYRVLGRLFTYEITVRPNHTLITDPPYNIVRHPSYAALFTLAAGLSSLLASQHHWNSACGISAATFGRYAILWPTFWIVLQTFSSVAIWRRCELEDRLMKQKFGPVWEKYRRDVPYKLLPGVF